MATANEKTKISRPQPRACPGRTPLQRHEQRQKVLNLLAKAKKPSKYRNRKMRVPVIGSDGRIGAIDFDSKREAQAYVDLAMRQKVGEIRELKLQPRFRLEVNGVHICDYVADFQWVEDAPKLCHQHIREYVVTADAKGFRNRVYLLKKKLMLACHGIEIREL